MSSAINSSHAAHPNEYDNGAPGLPIPFIVSIPVIISLGIIFTITYACTSGRQRLATPARDLESATRVPKDKDAIDLQTLDTTSPTQNYKEAKAARRTLTWASHQSSSAEVCAICLEILLDQDSVRRLKCKHVFHRSCIDDWFQRKHFDCPLCKSIYVAKTEGGPEIH